MQIATLRHLAKLVAIQALLDYVEENNFDCETRIVQMLKTDCFTAVSDSVLRRLVSYFPQKVISQILPALAPPHITELKLKGCTNAGFKGFSETLKRCPHLTVLDLTECEQMMLPEMFIFAGMTCPHLISVTVENCENVTDEVVQAILLGVPNLLHLNISTCNNVKDKVFLLSEKLQRSRETYSQARHEKQPEYQCHLTSVDMSGCRGITSTAIRHLTTLCGPTLKSVNIAWTQVDCTALLYLAGYGLPAATYLTMTAEAGNSPSKVQQALQESLQQLQQISDDFRELRKTEHEQHQGEPAESTNKRVHNINYTELEESDLSSAEITKGRASYKSQTASQMEFPSTSKVESTSDSKMEFPSTSKLESLTVSKLESPTVSKVESVTVSNLEYPSASKVEYTSTSKEESPSDSKVESLTEFKVESPSASKMESPTASKVEYPSASEVEFLSASKVECLSASKVEYPVASEGESASATSYDFQSSLDKVCHKCVRICTCQEISLKESGGSVTVMQSGNMPSDSKEEINSVSLEESEVTASNTVINTDSQSSFTQTGSSNRTTRSVCAQSSSVQTESGNRTTHSLSAQSAACLSLPSHFSAEDESEIFNQMYKPGILSLDINTIVFPDIKLGSMCLTKFFEVNRQLLKICISWKDFTDKMLHNLGEQCPDLREVSLIDCEKLTTHGMAKFGQLCRKIRNLDIKGVSFIMNAGITPFLTMPRLTSLLLAESSITDRTLMKISSLKKEKLLDLDLSWCEEITDKGINKICSTCSLLQSLRLRQCPAATNITLLLMAETCTNLKILTLSGVGGITDEAVVSLAQSLHFLEEIDISWNLALTDKSIGEIMRCCSRLVTACMSGLKQITTAPFLPIISDLARWRQYQTQPRYKLHERKMLENTGDEQVSSSDEEFGELYFPHRSTVYAPDLKNLILEYSDRVNDSRLAEIVAICRGSLQITDYYGEPIQPALHSPNKKCSLPPTKAFSK